MIDLEFYVEEESMRITLDAVVPLILADVPIADYTYLPPYVQNGKQDLLKALPKKLKRYRHDVREVRVFVLIDRDADDCLVLKQQLETIAQQVGLTTKSQDPQNFRVINRIVIEELEAWFFGDPDAIAAAYGVKVHNHAKYRDPDAIQGGAAEALKHELPPYAQLSRLPKIEVASKIAPHLQPDRNQSRSFQVFREALRSLIPLAD